MKRCLFCNARHESYLCNCTNCGHAPSIVNNFESYAPELAHDGAGFKADYFAELARLEGANFWFRSRNKLIIWAIKKYCSNFQSFLEIGCGTAFVLSGIAKIFPNASLFGSEVFIAGLGFSSTRLPSAKFMQMDAREIPFDSEFDVIGAFDVLEHIKEDKEVLLQINSALKPSGLILLTVPQHAWLWSAVDEHACHQRRYSAKDLHQKIEDSGFKIIRSTSFVSFLLPAMIASRILQKKNKNEKFDAYSELKIAPLLNSIFLVILFLERLFVKTGLNFPVGGSRLVVAKKM